MKFTAQIIAEFLRGEVEGDKNIEVTSISKIEEGKPGTLSFLANSKYENFIYTTDASIVLVNKSFKLQKPVNSTLIRVDDPYASFASLLELYQKSKPEPEGIDERASVHESTIIGKQVYIGTFTVVCKNVVIGNHVKIYPQVYIGENVVIEDNTVLHPGVRLYNDTKIGKNCIIHSGAVIGSDGFGFAPQPDGEHKKLAHIGNVVVEDNVEIGSNTTIDRATMGSTIIRKGAKLDNLIQIAHNCEIGERTFMAGQSGVSGSTKIGKNCLIGGQVGFAGHLVIADEVKVGAQAGIQSPVKEKGAVIQGSPAISIMNFQKSSIIFRSLPDLRMEVINLKKELADLKKELEKLRFTEKKEE
jgi:UDP-3-O-[3-hydroxymyristoyl] glucosamine N-acyltransferase